MSLLSLLSKLKPSATKDKTPEVAKSFPLIQQIREATHGKIVDLIIGKPYNSIRNWLKKKLENRLPAGLIDTFLPVWTEQKTLEEFTGVLTPEKSAAPQKALEGASSPISDLEKADKEAEKAEKDHMETLAKEFEIVSNQYRKDAGLQMVMPDDALQKLAAEVCDLQVLKRKAVHTPEEYRQQHNIQGEIITSGFSSPSEALRNFVASKDHYLQLMGSYSRMGYAIRRGVEESSGQTMYYLVVLYQHGKPLANENAVPKKEVPKKMPPPLLGSLPEYFEKTPVLKPYFDALDLRVQDQTVSYALDVEKTKTKPLSQGDFWVTFSKGEKKSSFLVSTCPVLFYRLGDDLKLRGIPFPEILNELDAPVSTAATSVAQPAAPAQPASLPEKQKEVKAASPAPTIEQFVQQAEKPSEKASRAPSIEDLKTAAEKISALQTMPEPEKAKPKEPEIMGLS